ncbi:ABC transporter permease [Hymenobacter terrenus]|uniref:ABC transporter permease n=1 Tax=Hymenobacter terrenus TaxID=1629124 RepID=UPI000619EE4A|nr:DUF3526 domain-containing protein [Hymenobacter terrenus]
MIRAIVEKELLEFRHDARLRWLALALYALFAVALWSGYAAYRSTSQTHQAAQEATYRQWLGQGAKNPHGAAHYGFYAYKPLSPLSLLDPGLEGYLGQAVWLEAHNQNEVKQREANDAGSLVRFGTLTVGFVWQFLVPLAIVLLSFNLFTKEHEGGTLRLLLSTETTPWALLQGKALALLRIVGTLVAPMLVLAVVAVGVAAGPAGLAAVLPRLALVLGLYALYFAGWAVGGLLVSTRARSSGVALITLLGFWVFGTFLVPRLSGSVAKAAFPAPSAFAFSHNVRLDNELGLDRHTPAGLRKKQLEARLLRQYGVDSISQLPVSYQGLSLQAGEDYGEQVYARNYGGLHRIYQRQDALMDGFSLLSPLLAMRNVSAGLAGTDLAKHLEFARQAEQHRELIADVMNRDITRNAVGQQDYKTSPDLWRQVPPFRYAELGLGQSLQAHGLGLAALALWLAALFFLLKQSAGRVRLRA